MAGQEQEQDRNEPATPFKLEEARKHGQVAKSLEVNSLVTIATALALAYAWGERVAASELELSQGLFAVSPAAMLWPAPIVQLGAATFAAVLAIYWMPAAALLGAAVLSNVLQTGPVLTAHPLKADFKRLNPASNLKRLVSPKLLFETIKTFVKLALFAGVLYLAIDALLPQLISSMDRDAKTLGPFLLHSGRGVAFKLLLVLLLVALVDLLYVRWDFARNMRMSRRELKEEVKRREGDPLVKAKLRELRKEAARRAGSLQRVPEADVLITNPVHLAVALRYRREEMAAPTVIAKGAADHALRMREVARQHAIPIVEDRPLAQALFRGVKVDQGIPEELYGAVARILARLLRERAERDRPQRGAEH